MRKRFMTPIVVPSVLFIVASPTLAAGAPAVQPPQQQPASKTANDPNEVICERQQQLGSRLASERVCKTRAEWAEERRLNRQTIEKIQTQRDLSH